MGKKGRGKVYLVGLNLKVKAALRKSSIPSRDGLADFLRFKQKGQEGNSQQPVSRLIEKASGPQCWSAGERGGRAGELLANS